MTNQEYAAGLRQIADWYAQHPEIPLPSPNLGIYTCNGRETAATVSRALGHAQKRTDGIDEELFVLHRDFGAVNLAFYFYRADVCTRKVLGTERVEAVLAPAYDREIVEWECEPLLGELTNA